MTGSRLTEILLFPSFPAESLLLIQTASWSLLKLASLEKIKLRKSIEDPPVITGIALGYRFMNTSIID